MSEGLLYEPRSFWSIANVLSTANAQLHELPRRHFYNGGQYPIEIRRIALAAINYQLTGTPLLATPAGVDQTSSVLSRVRIGVSFPQRFHLSKDTSLMSAMGAIPTAQPPVAAPANSCWNQSVLCPDHPLMTPRTGSYEWELSGHTPWVVQGDPDDVEAAVTSATLLYQEVGGLFAGSARSLTVPLRAYTGNTTVADPDEKWPYPPDDYGVGVPPAAIASPNWWPGSKFPAGGPNSFSSQESTRSGSTEISGLRIFWNQDAYDDELATAFAAAGLVAPRATPLSLRTGCRIRSVSGGTKEWWWRPGAPVALVFDTITPALVLQLKEPFTMGPGEQVDVEVEIPAITPLEGFDQPHYHIGVSLNGFAAIEG